MFDFRYHIVSLVAVFLALAIGIMLGSSIENRGVLKEQQERLVKSIEQDISTIKTKNTSLQRQLQAQKAFEAEVLPALTKDRLKDKKVAIVYFDDAGSNTLKAASLETLNQAGAKVTEIPLEREVLLNLKTANQEVADGSPNKYANLEKISAEFTSGAGPIIEQLQKENKLKLTADSLPLSAAVIFAGGNKPNLEEIALAKALRKNKLKVVFVDKSDNKFSKVDQFAEANIDTVDNINMVYGRISLVYVLTNSRRGHFGVGQSAEQLMPVLN